MYGSNKYGTAKYGRSSVGSAVVFIASALDLAPSLHAPVVFYDKKFSVSALDISAALVGPTVAVGKVFLASPIGLSAGIETPFISLGKVLAVSALNISATLHDSSEESEEIVSSLSLLLSLGTPTIAVQNREIIIKVNDVDVSGQVAYQSLNMSNNLYSEPDVASFEMVNSPSKSYAPAAGDSVEIIDTGVTVFKGLLVKISKVMSGFQEAFYLEFKDWTEELANILIAENYVSMTVNAIIADINTKYLTGYDITNVSDTTVVNGITFDNISVVDALNQLAELSGKNWYVGPEKEIFFFADNGIQSPFDLTDTNGTYEYSSLKIDEDLTQIRNKVTIKGNGIEAVTVEDATSQTAYGVREYFERDNNIDATNEATQKANALLSTFKNSIKIVSFTTKQPGLFAGQQIDIDSTLRGINETLNIENVQFRAESPFRFVYSVKATSQRLGRIEDLFKKAQETPNTTPSVGNQGSLQDIAFTAIDDETIQWSAGTITTADGNSYAISARASQALSSDHIIYFNPDVSVTELQISTTFTDGIGARKIPLAYATKNPVSTRGADIFPVSFGGKIQLDGSVHITDRSIISSNIAADAITANEIAANTITATEIAAGTITADRMNVSTISAISANLGSMTAGTITGALIQTATSGYRVLMDSSNGIRFYNSASQVGYIMADSGHSLILQTADNFYFLEGGTYRGQWDSGGITLPAGKAFQFTSGRSLIDASSEIQTDGDFRVSGRCYPRLDNTDNVELGSSSKRWKTLYSKNLNTGDIVFTDRYCPICEVEFEEGDCLINFVHKKDTTGISPVIYTVPAHFECVKDYKKNKHAHHQSKIKQWDEEHNAKVKVAEKEFDDEEEKKAVKRKADQDVQEQKQRKAETERIRVEKVRRKKREEINYKIVPPDIFQS